MKGKYNLTREKKHLTIPISKAAFIMIAKGGHDELYYPVNTDSIRWFIKFEYQDLWIQEIIKLGAEVFRLERDEFHFKNGISRAEIDMIAESLGVQIKPGRPEYGEEPHKLFFVLKLGKKKLL